jgi:hypothetical protein
MNDGVEIANEEMEMNNSELWEGKQFINLDRKHE